MKVKFNCEEISSYFSKEPALLEILHPLLVRKKNDEIIKLSELFDSDLPLYQKYLWLNKKCGLNILKKAEVAITSAEILSSILLEKFEKNEVIEKKLNEVKAILTDEDLLESLPINYYSWEAFYILTECADLNIIVANYAFSVLGFDKKRITEVPIRKFDPKKHSGAMTYLFDSINQTDYFFTLLPRLADEIGEQNNFNFKERLLCFIKDFIKNKI